jgi:hypothetical protein
MKPLTRKREIVTLALVICLCFSALGFKACSQSQQQKNIAWAKDVVSSLRAGRPYLAVIKPELLADYDKAINLGDSALLAVQAGNAQGAIELITELLPIFSAAAAAFTNNSTALAALALADIGLHFLLNHLPRTIIIAAKQRTGAARVNGVDPITAFEQEQVWGCAYLPDKCK